MSPFGVHSVVLARSFVTVAHGEHRDTMNVSPVCMTIDVERIAQGDPAAEESFVREFEAKIRMMARIRLRNEETARDLTQEILMAALEALRKGSLRDPGKLAAFVHGVARNVINNHFRSRDPEPVREPLETDLVWIEEDREQRNLVRRELESLDSLDRKILLMTLVEGAKPGEIAAKLAISGDVVRQRKLRATRRIAERLSQFSVGKPPLT